jgi:hypothetical protein
MRDAVPIPDFRAEAAAGGDVEIVFLRPCPDFRCRDGSGFGWARWRWVGHLGAGEQRDLTNHRIGESFAPGRRWSPKHNQRSPSPRWLGSPSQGCPGANSLAAPDWRQYRKSRGHRGGCAATARSTAGAEDERDDRDADGEERRVRHGRQSLRPILDVSACSAHGH